MRGKGSTFKARGGSYRLFILLWLTLPLLSSPSLYDSQTQLKETIVRSYPQLKKSRDSLLWGYKITAEGLDEEQKKIIEVLPEKREEGFLNNIGKLFNN